MKSKTLIFLVSFMVFLFGQAASVHAGDGEIIPGPPHLLNLYLYYDYDETDLQIMQPAFQAASELLYNATNGQMQIGVVRASELASFSTRADVKVLEGEGGAYTYLGGLGTPGLSIYLYRDQHRWTDNDGPDNNERGQFGIVHECGHYVFYLGDEYKGGTIDPRCLEDAGSTVACIMDGGTTHNNTRTEFCSEDGLGLATDHYPNNAQEDYHGESCWETMVDYVNSEYGLALTAPSVANPPNAAMPAGHQDISWVVVGDLLRYTLSIDRSYSMSGSKMDLTKIAADLFVDLVHPGHGEYLGVNSFSNTAKEEFAMTEVVNANVKANARTAIDNIAIQDMTAMGDGMRLSLNQITGNGTVARDDINIETIILLSDGVHNYGSEDPDDVIPDIKDRGVRVFTIGLGNPYATVYPLDEQALQDIADLTGGLYRHAPDETELEAIYTEYAAEIRGDNVSSEATDMMPAAEKNASKEKNVYVDGFTEEATFVLHWPAGKNYFNLTLRKPDGTTVDPTVAAGDPRTDYLEQDYYEYYRVREPEKGTWKLIVSISDAWVRVTGEKIGIAALPTYPRFTTQVLSRSPSVGFRVHADKFYYKYPLVPVIRALVAAKTPVAGAIVQGVVKGPKGESHRIQLFDDGQFSHGDIRADDGIYSNRFLHFTTNGPYTVHLSVENKNGVQARPDEIMPADWKPEPVAPFTRTSKYSLSVHGLPDSLPKPEIRKVSPNRGGRGDRIDLTIEGRNFVENANVNFSHPGILTERIDVVDAGKIEVRIRIADDAAGGYSDVTVINPGGMQDTARDAFRVGGIPLFWWILIIILILLLIIILIWVIKR